MRALPVLALSAAVMLGACQNPDGSLNVPATAALGVGAAIAGVAIASAANDRPRHGHYRYDQRPSYGYRQPAYGYYGRPHYGQGYGYRRW
ncbi:hypothetical protein [Falsiroseomonas sp. CW058]|uniref:hypothetical protein n=1 Tax=Falsiroseomonas sp. CW058 TaxID=3388664 RepID=UPI003D31346B